MKALTGIKPTNLLHIGNYFGALLPATQMQEEYELFMMVADLHAITVPQTPTEMRQNLAYIIATYLAAGIDPKKTTLFQQSKVPAHSQLGWVMECLAKMGEAERMTQYKDKARVKGESVSVGLFTYPLLMAADILLYDTDVVPVGFDQKQHVELARDLAERFNKQYGQTFTVPKPVIKKEGAKILRLDDPERKMSKSDGVEKSYISLMDEPDVIAKKIRGAVTDSLPQITLSDDRPGVKNLLTILALCKGESLQTAADSLEGKGAKELKEATAVALVDFLRPVQGRIRDYLNDLPQLEQIIADGSGKAQARGEKKVAAVLQALGFNLQ